MRCEKTTSATDPSSHSLPPPTTPLREKGAFSVYEKGTMNERRNCHDIIAEILKVASESKMKTHIMYELKLSYPQLVEYLSILVEKEFLANKTVRRGKRETTMYRTTLKGIDLLGHLESINKLWTEKRIGI